MFPSYLNGLIVSGYAFFFVSHPDIDITELLQRQEAIELVFFPQHADLPLQVLHQEIVVSQYTTSPQGTLVFTDATWSKYQGVFWVDRQGGETPITQEAGAYSYPSLSPDGRQIVLTHDAQTWILELSGGRRMRLTQQGTSFVPQFSPDGKRVIFGSYQPDESLQWVASDGSGVMEFFAESGTEVGALHHCGLPDR